MVLRTLTFAGLLLLSASAAMAEGEVPDLGSAFRTASPDTTAERPTPGESRPLRSTAWGIWGISRLQIEPAEDHVADVVFENRLTSPNYDFKTWTMGLEGLTVEVSISSGDGRGTEVITVKAPPGFRAYPETRTVEDDETVVIEIHAIAIS